jgi:ubiquinone biosynthesis protein UbiJ
MPVNPLVSVLAEILERISSATLALDPEARAHLAAFDGQILLFDITSPPAQLRVIFGAGSLRVMANSEHNRQPPQTIVRGSIFDLLAAFKTGKLPPGLNVDGDELLLLALQRSVDELRLNLREPLERFAEQQPVSDLLGHAELAFATLREAFADATVELRKNSSQLFANEPEVDDLARRMEDLQMRIDRASARIDALQPDTTSSSPQ